MFTVIPDPSQQKPIALWEGEESKIPLSHMTNNVKMQKVAQLIDYDDSCIRKKNAPCPPPR